MKEASAKTESASDGGIKKVLVCDDERHIVRLIQVNLERQGYEIVTAFTGEEALSKLLSDRFDLAVIDSHLPDMTGREVVGKIRANPDTAHIKVILLDKKGDRDDDDDMPGPDLYLTKPFNPIELVNW